MIELNNINVHLPGFTLQGIDLTVQQGEFFVLLGPTGAGKTLILESIVGLTKLSQGSIRINGRDVTRLAPEKRGIGIVYQDHALFPHLSVRQNIAYGLRYHRRADFQSNASFENLIKRLGLSRLLGRSVGKLSGGEKQRVALARALAIDPAVLLLDEPLASLDPNFREEILELLKDLHNETALTVMMVTHDFTEAHYLAQRVAVINTGRIEQIGSVPDVFLKPGTRFVAQFVGMKNIFPASFKGRMAKVGELFFKTARTNNGHSRIAIRPEHIGLLTLPQERSMPNTLEGAVARISNQGVYSSVVVDVSGIQFQSILTTSKLWTMHLVPGRRVYINVAPEHIHFLS